jgi:ArsR family transcriptional regulator, arsenate/arsenite/antimonite-responsive transcriptional repressor
MALVSKRGWQPACAASPKNRCRRTTERTHFHTLNEAKMATVIDEPLRDEATQYQPLHEHPSDGHKPLSDDVAKDLVQFFKLLADETRLRILFYLKERGETNVQTLCGLLEQSQPSVSHHLALLRVAGLIDMRREGKHNFYRTMPHKFEQMMGTMFSTLPGDSSRSRFANFVLSYTHPEQD